MDIIRENSNKKTHKTPNNIGPKGSQQHGGHFKWT